MAIAALSTKNPYYLNREIDWMMSRDAYGGERYIKEKGQEYLPATAAMMQAGMNLGQNGFSLYSAYKGRAVYHELVKPAAMSMLGVMHQKPALIELPSGLEPMRDSATFNGESLDWLLMKINEQQMVMGRYGLMLDINSGAGPNAVPYIVGYNAEAITNWDSTIVSSDRGKRETSLVILNETGFERRAGLAWSQTMRYRVLAMAGLVRDTWDVVGAADEDYVAAETVSSSDAAPGMFHPVELGGRRLKAIPFVFIGPRDLVPEPDAPMLMPLVRIALAIYRTEADYRQALFMQGQDTLVVIGQQADASANRTQVGAFGSIDLPIGGDAKYIGATSDGIKDLEAAIQNDLKRAAQLGSQLLSERGNEAEAAQALNVRVASRTATLTTVAQVGAAGLERILKQAAVWKGEDPSKVKVTPNLDFADTKAQAQDLVYLMTGKSLGATLSQKSIHGWLGRNEFTDMTFEEEKAQIEKEGPTLVGGTPGSAGAGGPMDVLPGPGKRTAPRPGAKGNGGENGGAPAGSATLAKPGGR